MAVAVCAKCGGQNFTTTSKGALCKQCGELYTGVNTSNVVKKEK